MSYPYRKRVHVLLVAFSERHQVNRASSRVLRRCAAKWGIEMEEKAVRWKRWMSEGASIAICVLRVSKDSSNLEACYESR